MHAVAVPACDSLWVQVTAVNAEWRYMHVVAATARQL
jgi:hypothetical protein